MTISCPDCNVSLETSPEFNGRRVQCTNCGHKFPLQLDRAVRRQGSPIIPKTASRKLLLIYTALVLTLLGGILALLWNGSLVGTTGHQKTPPTVPEVLVISPEKQAPASVTRMEPVISSTRKTPQADNPFDFEEWQAKYDQPVEIQDWLTNNPHPFAKRFDPNVSFMLPRYFINLGPLGVRTFMHDQNWAYRFPAVLAKFPKALLDAQGPIQNAFEVTHVQKSGPAFTRDLASTPLPWGRSPAGPERTILFSVPNDLAALAQLQHADLTGDDRSASVGHQPGYAFGNSYASPFVKRVNTMQTRTDYEIIGTPNYTGARFFNTRYYDISYLLNVSVWDSYFLSTIPASDTPQPQNPSLIVSGNPSELRDPVKAASNLMIKGAFNVNSTDKTAWKTFLASARHQRIPSESTTSSQAAFPRSLEQSDSATLPPSGNAADSFSGFRRLSDDQLDALASEIVRQVRLRGPFLSLSHFVNRALAPITDQPELSRSGALQSAIDESGINISFDGSKNAFSDLVTDKTKNINDRVTLGWKYGAPRADMDGIDTDYPLTNADPNRRDWAVTSTDNNYGAVASILADQEMLKDYQYLNEQGYRSTSIPGWLTQADVLQVIGPSLTARSDTFRIRSYGEALDTAGKVVARAWCEAIVQRKPDYLDSAQRPDVRGANLSLTNRTYGRRFEITSFRWLSPEEI